MRHDEFDQVMPKAASSSGVACRHHSAAAVIESWPAAVIAQAIRAGSEGSRQRTPLAPRGSVNDSNSATRLRT